MKRTVGNNKLIWIALIKCMPFKDGLVCFLNRRPELEAHEIRNSNQNDVKY
ncbi:hypothetical protein SAMN04515667_1299 [Formosa sp. Hel1_31_208]|uniref:hypothetical protein n=1 Tax=Formosa sp. Hel1_31_208 TaxID=1798225 RepID=UPI000879C180|nr:hypothetical protein [Formosa sp. Hel1_31_208]SDS05201.1 hypothetical protein SAMN04515667_1299 [Formosa sp. Hel1_31_208]